MENLLPLIIFGLIAAVSAWLKKRREEEGRDWELPPTQPSQPVPPPARSWEEQMRELLAGAGPVSPAPPPLPASPPPPPSPASPRPRVPRPQTARPQMARPQMARPQMARTPAPPRPFMPPVVHAAPEPAAPVRSDLLARAHATHERAMNVDARVRERLKAVSEGLSSPRKERRGSVSPALARGDLGFLRSRGGLRSAVVASIILGPPKALEQE